MPTIQQHSFAQKHHPSFGRRGQAAIDARQADASESGDADGEEERHCGQERGRRLSAGAIADSSDEEGGSAPVKLVSANMSI